MAHVISQHLLMRLNMKMSINCKYVQLKRKLPEISRQFLQYSFRLVSNCFCYKKPSMKCTRFKCFQNIIWVHFYQIRIIFCQHCEACILNMIVCMLCGLHNSIHTQYMQYISPVTIVVPVCQSFTLIVVLVHALCIVMSFLVCELCQPVYNSIIATSSHL